MTPGAKENMNLVLLTVYEWRSVNLKKLASIVLRKFETTSLTFKTFSLQYNSTRDTVLAAETKIQMSGGDEPNTYLFEFVLQDAIN